VVCTLSRGLSVFADVADRSVFLVPSEPGNAASVAAELEKDLETRFLGEGYRHGDGARRFWRMQARRCECARTCNCDLALGVSFRGNDRQGLVSQTAHLHH
jgi:hypothetical protein